MSTKTVGNEKEEDAKVSQSQEGEEEVCISMESLCPVDVLTNADLDPLLHDFEEEHEFLHTETNNSETIAFGSDRLPLNDQQHGKVIALQANEVENTIKNVQESTESTIPCVTKTCDSQSSSKRLQKTQRTRQMISSLSGGRHVPILPRSVPQSTSCAIYEPPPRGKGTGKKRGAYRKEPYRESFTSCDQNHRSRPSITYPQGKSEPLKPLFVEREVCVSLDPDPLLHASPKSGSIVTETQTFDEYELDVSPHVLKETKDVVSSESIRDKQASINGSLTHQITFPVWSPA